MLDFSELLHASSSVLGLGIVWYAGQSILMQLGHKHLADGWTIMITVGGAVVVAKYVWRGLKEAAAVFHIAI